MSGRRRFPILRCVLFFSGLSQSCSQPDAPLQELIDHIQPVGVEIATVTPDDPTESTVYQLTLTALLARRKCQRELRIGRSRTGGAVFIEC